MRSDNKVLRTVYLDPEVDSELTAMCYAQKVSRSELIEKFILLGMKEAEKLSPKPIKKKSSPKDRSFEDWLQQTIDGSSEYTHRYYLPEGTHYHAKYVYDVLMAERKKSK